MNVLPHGGSLFSSEPSGQARAVALKQAEKLSSAVLDVIMLASAATMRSMKHRTYRGIREAV